MTKEERLLRQEQRERAKAIEAAAREAGRGPLDLPYLLLVLTLVGAGLIMLFSASFPSAYYEEGNPAYYLIRQGIFAILGITAMFIVGRRGGGVFCLSFKSSSMYASLCATL